MHEVLAPTVVAGEIICTIDRMKIGFALNTEADWREEKKCRGKQSPKPTHLFSRRIFIYYIIFLSDAAQCRASEEEEQTGHKKGGLVGDRG